jgi:hypothetical protein
MRRHPFQIENWNTCPISHVRIYNARECAFPGARARDIETKGDQALDNQSVGIPRTPSSWRPRGGTLDSNWPHARVGHFAFETDAFYSDCFC